MFTSFRKMAIALGIGVVLATSGTSYAVPIVGSLPLIEFGATQDGTDLSVSTMFTASDTQTSDVGVGDYSPIPVTTSFGPTSLDLSNLVGFSISNATYGSFVSTSGLIFTQNANFLNVFFLGDYTPGPGLAAGLDVSPTSLRLTLNQSGTSISGALTLNSPPVPPGGTIPEPSTISLLGVGLLGLGWSRWRHARSAK